MSHDPIFQDLSPLYIRYIFCYSSTMMCQWLNFLSSILTSLLTWPKSDTLLHYSNDPFWIYQCTVWSNMHSKPVNEAACTPPTCLGRDDSAILWYVHCGHSWLEKQHPFALKYTSCREAQIHVIDSICTSTCKHRWCCSWEMLQMSLFG